MMERKSVLILCPDPRERGGVADYYRLVKKHFKSNRMDLEFCYTGRRSGGGLENNRMVRFGRDLISLLKMVRSKDLVVINPSLDPRAIVRDGAYHFVSKTLFRKKTLVFFHGWDPRFERSIARYAKKAFRRVFNFDRGVVLAQEFKKTLETWGYDSKNVTVETTIYEGHDCQLDRDFNKVIFLSRFEEGKGCLEAVKTVELLVNDFEGVRLFMVGDGTLAPDLKAYVTKHGLEEKVIFTGWLEGEKKYELLKTCGVMLYPTSFGEGMPICLLEGMGMGLVVITRPVAGIRDILVDGENGFLIESLEPRRFADRLRYVLQNNSAGRKIAEKSKREAEARFEIKNVAKRIEQIYFETGQ